MQSLAKWLVPLAALFFALFWLLTRPVDYATGLSSQHNADLANGERIFHAGGCASCHGDDLAGGLEMHTEFGTFLMPNITPHPEAGIGGWTGHDFLNAVKAGISPDGKHYYPSFPYTSYTRMNDRDVLDLKAYLDLRPSVGNKVESHELAFPWNFRRGIGLWKLLFMDSSPVVDSGQSSDVLDRGRYLVESVGHCGECHTPRNGMGAMDLSRWLAGGPNPDGDGRIPNITPHEEGIGSWSERDIAYYLESGFTPDFDMVGSSMVEVQENMARLSDADRAAMAVYLKAVPALAKQAD